MDVSLPGLVVNVEARIDKLEKALKRANAAQRGSADQMERRAKQSADRLRDTYGAAGDGITKSLKGLAPLVGGFLGGMVGLGVSGIAGNLAAITKGIAQVGDEAKRAGLSAEVFQEWKFVAEQNRIGVDSLVDGFKELNLRADEFVVTGGGSAAESFKRLGYSGKELAEKLKDPSALMLEIIGRMQKLDKAAQIRVSDELFGGSAGERFVELIGQGEAGLSRTIDRAHEVGAVMDSDLIAKAAELDKKFGELSTRLDSFFKNAAISAAEFFGLIRTYQETMPFDYKITLSVAGQEVADTLATIPEVSEEARAAIESITVEYGDLSEEARRLVSALTDGSSMMNGLGNTQAGASLTDLSIKTQQAVQDFEAGTLTGDGLRAKLEEIGAETTATISALGDLDKARLSGITDAVAGLLDWIGQIPGKVAEAVAAVNDAEGLQIGGAGSSGTEPGKRSSVVPQSPLAPNTSPRPKPAPALLGETDVATKPGKGGGGGGGQNDYAQKIEALSAETIALENEAAALIAAASAGKTYGNALEIAKTKAELLTAAQRSGVAVTPELEASLDRLAAGFVQAGASAEEAATRLKSVQEEGKRGAQAVSDIFMSLATGSMTAQDALGQLLIQMAKVALQKKLMAMAEGGGAAGSVLGFIGGLLGGFAEGGYTGAGGAHEPAGVVHRGEFVISKPAVQRLGIGNLEGLHRGALQGYAKGGLVGGATALQKPALGRAGASDGAMTVSISAPVTVNGSAGTHEQNSDLAKQMAREMDATLRGVMRDEIVKQMRPGAMLNKGRG